MRTKKFIADDMKSALEDIKRELGAEAMIIATRPVRRGLLGNGVEVTAADDREPAFDAPAAAKPVATSTSLTDLDVDRLTAPLRAELRAIHGRLRAPSHAAPASDMRIVEALRCEVGALRRAVERLGGASTTEQPLAEIINASGLIAAPPSRRMAVVGPTGVGKTTTIAKLAARAALVDEERVVIVTLDTFRVGAEDQIRAYADLIGVPLLLCPDPSKLGATLARARGADRIFIDTPGYGPREDEALAVLADALAQVADLEMHLAVPAALAAHDLDRTAARYRAVGASRLLFTKLDESSRLEEIVRAPLRLSMPLHFVTTGQRVPEDIETPTAGRLLALAETGLELDREAA